MSISRFWVIAIEGRGPRSLTKTNTLAIVAFTEADALLLAGQDGYRGQIIASGQVEVLTGLDRGNQGEMVGHPPFTRAQILLPENSPFEGSSFDGSSLWLNVYDEPVGGKGGPFSNRPPTSIHYTPKAAAKEAEVRELVQYSLVGRAQITLQSGGRLSR
jgi:hypothetical protein